MFRWARRVALVVMLMVVVAVVLLVATPQGRAVGKTALFIAQVVPASPVKPLEWLAPEPIRRRVHVPLEQGQGTADIYRPAGDGPHAAVLLFLGVAPAGADDPRVVRLGKALARSGMVTMFYWSASMREEQLDPQDVDRLVAAFDYLRRRPFVDAERAGMGGFCVGASFVLMAAAQEGIRDEVAFVNAFGPYFSMQDLVRAIASRTRFYEDERRPWDVDPLTYRVFATELTSALEPPEAARLRRAALEDRLGSIDEDALSPASGVVYRLLSGVPLEETDSLVERLPASLRNQFDRVSPRTYLDDLEAPVLIMHDRDDPLVPIGESRRLRDALPPAQTVRYTEFRLFQHVDPTRPVAPQILARELTRFFSHLYPVFRLTT